MKTRSLGELAYNTYIWPVGGLFALLTGLGIVLLPGLSLRRQAARGAARGLLRLAGVRLQVEGLENLPTAGCIVAANHASYLDGIILTAALPARFSFVIKREITSVPVVGTLLRRLGSHFVDRSGSRHGASDASRMFRAARRGEALGIFPEGTFIAEPGLQPFRLGGFLAAARSNLPVVPVGIRGSRHILRAGSWALRRRAIRVSIGAPETAPSADRPGALILQERIRDHIAALSNEPKQ